MKSNLRFRVVCTCYDYPAALALDRSDIDVVFVGDSVGTTYLGFESTIPVTAEMIAHHTAAVSRARAVSQRRSAGA